MSDTVISVENLSKRYLVGHNAPTERYQSLRDTIVRHGKNFARKTLDMARGRQIVQGDSVEEFWALKDVSFEVKQGEVLGIIGRNGAGKSTLLKILSRITEPTSGRVTLRGRVASLLEVGTGFHPELTGRENIFLNGAILGMSKAEIRKKFDEIVDFAGVEKFLDTPVKRYSSGMYVRLAFAVAAHLEPEILIVDEVLAVGDADFQKKCLGKMQDVANAGRTVLLVSHNLSQISNLASKGLVLQGGEFRFYGDISDSIQDYSNASLTSESEFRSNKSYSEPHLSFLKIETSESGGIQSYGKKLSLVFELMHKKEVEDACFSFQIINYASMPVVHLSIYCSDVSFGESPGKTTLRCTIPFTRLNIGHYRIRTFFSGPPGSGFFEMVDPPIGFEVIRSDKSTLFGWRSEACTYFEDCAWDLTGAPIEEMGSGTSNC